MTFTALRILGAHHAAFCAILVALMLASIPVGAYMMLNAGSDEATNGITVILAGLRIVLPIDAEIAYVFAVLWCIYAVIIGVALLRPRTNIIHAITRTISGKGNCAWLYENHMLATISLFSILIMISSVIDMVQANFLDVIITPPDFGSNTMRLYDATKAPIIEEIGFRALLIGVPLAAIFVTRSTPARLLYSLLFPHTVHGNDSRRIALILIVASSALFGVLHIIGSDSWSAGKATQASAAGLILGWAYYRHGLIVSVLIHWASNYFILSSVYFLSAVYGGDATAHIAFEVFLVAAGMVSAAFIVAGRMRARRHDARTGESELRRLPD